MTETVDTDPGGNTDPGGEMVKQPGEATAESCADYIHELITSDPGSNFTVDDAVNVHSGCFKASFEVSSAAGELKTFHIEITEVGGAS